MRAKSCNDINEQEDRCRKLNRFLYQRYKTISRVEIILRAATNARAKRGISIFQNPEEKKIKHGERQH